MRPEGQRVGMAVCEHHRIAKRYGTVGEVVGRYGGEEYLAVDVRFSDGSQRLFWPGDLEEAPSSSQPSWWRSVLGGPPPVKRVLRRVSDLVYGWPRDLAREERSTMIREGDRVRVLPREQSPTSMKYAGQTGVVTMTSPSVYGPLLFVQMDGNPDDVDTGFSEDDLEEVQEWEEF